MKIRTKALLAGLSVNELEDLAWEALKEVIKQGGGPVAEGAFFQPWQNLIEYGEVECLCSSQVELWADECKSCGRKVG